MYHILKFIHLRSKVCHFLRHLNRPVLMGSERVISFLPMRQSLFHFSGVRNFCLADGLEQLTRDVKSDVRILNVRSDINFAPS